MHTSSRLLGTALLTALLPKYCALAAPARPFRPVASEAYARPLSFEANQGQTDSRVRFLSRGRGYTLFLDPGEAVLALQGSQGAAALQMRIVGARPAKQITGLNRLSGTDRDGFRGRDGGGRDGDGMRHHWGPRRTNTGPTDMEHSGGQRL